jgi:protein-L-isoaspartate(D-aspartate) O-methyltransferase
VLPREARLAQRHARHAARALTQTAPPTQEDLAGVIAASGVTDQGLLQAFRDVPRAGFVPPADRRYAYLDSPLPIPHGQVTTQPSLIAKMIEPLRLDSQERVLEIGTGHGFQTALLARLAGFVSSVERWPDLARTARENLARQGSGNVEVVVGDGSLGLPERAPFDAIVVSAAFPSVPQPLAEQLAEGGRLVHPVGRGGEEDVMLFSRQGGELTSRRRLTGAHFVRLYGRHAFPEED